MPKILLINTQKLQETTTVSVEPEKGLNQECLLGRDERCCLVLDDSKISRIHGKIFFRNGNYYYNDLGSRNGTRLNNEVVKLNQDYLLKPSDTLALGDHLLWIQSIGAKEAKLNYAISPTPQEYMPVAMIPPESINRWSQGELNARCVRIIDETQDVKTFCFVADPPVLFTYQPGQFTTLDLEINGKRVKRSYSISSTPSRPHTLEITVKRVPAPADEPDAPPGLVSNWLHDNIKVGSQVKMSSPMGKFTCFANPSPKLLLISAGSGITPMMSMARWLYDTSSDVDILFFHSACSLHDIIFRQELELMAARYSNFKLAITLTRTEAGYSWVGYQGRLNELMLRSIAPDFLQRNVYVCGPNAFMESTKSLLQKNNFPMKNYYEESFGGTKKKRKAVAEKNKATTISISKKTTIEDLINKISTSSINGHIPPSTSIIFPSPALSESEQNAGTIELPVAPAATTPITTSKATTPTTSSPAIVFAQSGQEISCDGEESILEVAQAEDIELPYGCGMGVCGQCKLRKLEGEVTYDEEPDCEEGYILTCVAKPVDKVVIST